VVFVGKSQNPFLTKSRLIAERSSAEPKLNARAGKKEGGWGGKEFLPALAFAASFFATAIFHISPCEMFV